MITDRSIVCFAHDWEGDPTSKTHIMRILAAGGNRVLWVNSIGMRRPAATRRDFARLVAKLRRATRGCRRVAPDFYVADPLVLPPLPGVPGIERANTALLAATIRRFARQAGVQRPILWTFLPNTVGLVGRLDESLVVYHCVDEYRAFSGVAPEALGRMEDELVRRADVVFASSESLWQTRRAQNPRSFFVSHGVDVEHFGRALDPSTPVAPELENLEGPVLGFFGLIADWVDLDLLRALALARPDRAIVLVGRVATDVSAIASLPNVHLVGQRPYASLPEYCRGFDVALLPFRMSALTRAANPLKLREYLAAGLPVVSSALPEVERYDDVVRIADGPEAWLRAIDDALARRSPAAARRRADRVSGESWRLRVEELSRAIESVEPSRRAVEVAA